MPNRMRRLKALGIVSAAGLVSAVFLASPAHSAPATSMGSMSMSSMPTSGMTLRQRFDYLAAQHSNNCGLQPSSFATMGATARLQGACCGPMDAKLFPTYAKQIRALAHYDHRYVPSDPYNMSVALARRLVAFNDTILLTSAQQKVFDAAMPLSPEKAPCCCHCWRWTAFEGQAKYFIARRRYTAQQVAKLWGLDDGCGDTSGGMTMTG